MFQAGDLARAADVYAALHAETPGDAVAAYRFGLVRLAQGREDEGRALIEAALAADPEFKYAEQARDTIGAD